MSLEQIQISSAHPLDYVVDFGDAVDLLLSVSDEYNSIEAAYSTISCAACSTAESTFSTVSSC